MIVICYRENGEQRYDCVDSIDRFTAQHPNAERTYVFTGDGVINNAQMYRLSENLAYDKEKYGIDSTDIGRSFYNSRGEKCTILGIKPTRYKYPVTFYNEAEESIRKCSANFIRKALADSPLYAAATP